MEPGQSSAPVVPGSGRVDPFPAIDADLDALDHLPLDEQVAVFGRLHTALTTALAATGDTGTGGRAGA